MGEVIGRAAELEHTAPAEGAAGNQLAQTLSELARTLEAEDDTDQMLGDLVAAAVAQIPGVDEGSISVVQARREVVSQSPSAPCRTPWPEAPQPPCGAATDPHVAA